MSESGETKNRADREARAWQALGEVADHPVVAAWRDQARQARPPRPTLRYGRWALAAALVLMIAGGLTFGLLARVAHAPESYATGLGERRTLTLTDGSSVTLNTSSRIEVAYRAGERAITLHSGQAAFDVAPDSRRPFVVSAAGRRIRALGTIFDVHVHGVELEVTLLEGKVSVTGQGPVIELAPGQQLAAAAGAAPAIRAADIARVTGWRSGWIVFDRSSLAEAIEEVGRYTRERIVCDDPRLQGLHVSGTFRTGEVDGFIDALAQVHPLTIDRSVPGEVRLTWRE
jgi:transmembrane sensor